MEWLIVLATITVLVIVVAHHYSGSGNKGLGIKGKLVWTDHGRQTRPFFNKTFQVFGKPDLMYRTKDGILAVEFKSRKGRVFSSDTVQAKCASLAARGAGFNVTKVLVKTASDELYVALPRSDAELFQEIEQSVIMARQAKKGLNVPSLPDRRKCYACAYRNACNSAAYA